MKQDFKVNDPFLKQINEKFPLLKKQIIFYFVSPAGRNSSYFCVPYRMIHDMMLRYGILCKTENGEDFLIPVQQAFLENWNMKEEELYLLAADNTPTLLPVYLRPINEVLRDFLSENEVGVMDEEVYVLTNVRGYLGAAALLYKDVLRSFSEKLGTDFYILPSSIHEVILLPVRGQKKELLQYMVEEINKKEVANTDMLSNTVYKYERKLDRIIE